MRSGLPLLVAVSVTALLAAGCGGSADDAPGGAEESAPDVSDLKVPTAGWETDFTQASVPLGEFLSGGPGKDGIPAIDAPRFVAVEEATRRLEGREPVIELELDSEARAYPLQILIWHEIVNDEVAGTPLAVTFCPLCNTALAFDRRVDGRVLDFGTTGNLRHSDLVMYDRQTESWWQQFGGEAIVGELTGTELEPVPVRVVAWEEFERRHPDGLVLSTDTGFNRPYGRNPYVGYDDVARSPLFPTPNRDDDRLEPKERVVFVERNDDAIAVPFPALEQAGTLEVEVGGDLLVVEWLGDVRSALDQPTVAGGRLVGSADVRTAGGEQVAFDTPFWFAVAAFRPDIRIVPEGEAERSSAPSALPRDEDGDGAPRHRRLGGHVTPAS